MIVDQAKVIAVIGAYRQVLTQTKRAGWAKVEVPPETSKLFSNSVKFFDAATDRGIALPVLMKVALDNFTQWWCQKTFKKNHPPYSIVSGEGSRLRALKNIPQTITPGKSDALADFYVEHMKGYPVDVAEGLILNGLCGDDPNLNFTVLNKLRQERLK